MALKITENGSIARVVMQNEGEFTILATFAGDDEATNVLLAQTFRNGFKRGINYACDRFESKVKAMRR